jgi:hypothetical protein
MNVLEEDPASVFTSTMKMNALFSTEKTVPTYQTLCHDPDHSKNLCYREDLINFYTYLYLGVCSSETLPPIYHATRRHIPEDTLGTHRR